MIVIYVLSIVMNISVAAWEECGGDGLAREVDLCYQLPAFVLTKNSRVEKIIFFSHENTKRNINILRIITSGFIEMCVLLLL